MNRFINPQTGLRIAAVLIVGEALAQSILPPFRAWEIGTVIFSALIGWGLLRESRIAWGVAVFGALAQIAAGIIGGLSIWLMLGGAVLLVCLLGSPVRIAVFKDGAVRFPRTGDAALPLPGRLSMLGIQAGMQAEGFLARVDRRWVVKGGIAAGCLFLLVGIVGSWHGKLKHQTAATEATWTIVVTTYKVALVGLVLLVVGAVIGASLRRRQGGAL